MKAFAQVVTQQVEDALKDRHASPFALPARDIRREPLELEGLNEALGGGVPLGVITELVGPEGSGRTTAALSFFASLMQRGDVCAWVDVADALSPESAAAAGVDLQRLLWVRCGVREEKQNTAPVLGAAPRGMLQSEFGPASRPVGGGGSPHPRNEGRDMPSAIATMLHTHGGLLQHQLRREKRMIGTPGAPNRPLSQAAPDREEQVNSDRLPPRRGDNLRALVKPGAHSLREFVKKPAGVKTPARKPWTALDQALRAVDLLLQAGGFGAIVLDLGSTPAEFAWRIPLATWFRYRATCERSRTTLLVLSQYPCARSSAELVVRMEQGAFEADGKVVTGVRYRAQTERNRSAKKSTVVSIRKPVRSEPEGTWHVKAVTA